MSEVVDILNNWLFEQRYCLSIRPGTDTIWAIHRKDESSLGVLFLNNGNFYRVVISKRTVAPNLRDLLDPPWFYDWKKTTLNPADPKFFTKLKRILESIEKTINKESLTIKCKTNLQPKTTNSGS
mgnify:CR=1 FL=1